MKFRYAPLYISTQQTSFVFWVSMFILSGCKSKTNLIRIKLRGEALA